MKETIKYTIVVENTTFNEFIIIILKYSPGFLLKIKALTFFTIHGKLIKITLAIVDIIIPYNPITFTNNKFINKLATPEIKGLNLSSCQIPPASL